MLSNPSETPVQFVKGVGPARAKLLANLGVHTAEDLLYLFPRRYEDRTRLTPIKELKAGQTQAVAGTVIVGGGRKTWFTKKHVFEIVVGDDGGRIFCVWFNQPYLDKYFKVGQEVVLYGRVEVFKKRLQLTSPEYELISAEDRSLNMGRIVPIYPLTKGITQRYVRRLTDACLDSCAARLRDIVPEAIRKRQGLNRLSQSIRQVHFPSSEKERQKATDRIAFEEFFLFQVSVILRRQSLVQKKGIAHRIDDKLAEEYEAALPFTLTGAQRKVLEEIACDMRKERPMLRLLQGDVGSGKTAAAFFGCIAAWRNGHQAAVMAPTEILARQHYENFKFKGLKTALLISSMAEKEKNALCARLKKGDIDLVIGTHALLEGTVAFKSLGFVVIDEQHKFGVGQRALLSEKSVANTGHPHVLVMTATPIPRTLCLTLYGDLDVSVLDQMPPGRGKVSTYHFPQEKAPAVYEKVRQMVRKGTQAYIIYPMIEENEKMELKTARAMFAHFQKFEFADLRLGLVHGQMDRLETEEIMLKFKRGELDILVATTILEVGIDVVNANVMVIEHAERFGLSQLHQMRGRIGRGEKDAVCILVGDPVTEESRARLEAITKTIDGFKIAEYDLQIRGPGHYFGRHQHGLNELRADPLTQAAILEKARKEAIDLVQADTQLAQAEHKLIKETITKRYPQYLEMLLAG